MSGEVIYLVIKNVIFSSDVIGFIEHVFLLIGLLSCNRTVCNGAIVNWTGHLLRRADCKGSYRSDANVVVAK